MSGAARRALVVGGSGGLGQATVKTLAAKGMEVAFTYHRNAAGAEALSAALAGESQKARYYRMDLADTEQVLSVMEQAGEDLGGLDALVFTSGQAVGRGWSREDATPALNDITPGAFDEMMAVNVRGVFFACQRASRMLQENGGGRIVITGSIEGVKIAHPPADYVVCKAALWGMTRVLAHELGPNNILVNMVAPGALEGGMSRWISDSQMKEYIKHSSLRRTGRYAEIASIIAFLAGEENTYLTGQAITLDGGL